MGADGGDLVCRVPGGLGSGSWPWNRISGARSGRAGRACAEQGCRLADKSAALPWPAPGPCPRARINSNSFYLSDHSLPLPALSQSPGYTRVCPLHLIHPPPTPQRRSPSVSGSSKLISPAQPRPARTSATNTQLKPIAAPHRLRQSNQDQLDRLDCLDSLHLAGLDRLDTLAGLTVARAERFTRLNPRPNQFYQPW